VFLDDPTTQELSPLAIIVDDGGSRSRRLTTGDASPDADGTIFTFPIPFIALDGADATHVTFEGSDRGLSDNMGIVSFPFVRMDSVLVREGDAAPVVGTFAVDFTGALAFASTVVAPDRMGPSTPSSMARQEGALMTTRACFSPHQMASWRSGVEVTPHLNSTLNSTRSGSDVSM
jgi:hypothetical protein